MSFVISDEYLPAVLTAKPMTDEEFLELCAQHPDLFFEMTADGQLIVTAPTQILTGARNQTIGGELYVWAKKDGRGIAFDSSTGFVLPNGARRSPDASWVPVSRVSDAELFGHFCPDFVIELKSKTDSLKALKEKMQEYMANGAQLGWLIDPVRRTVTIYRPDTPPETQTDINSISGEGPVATFTLDLTRVWSPLGVPQPKVI
jgi:Uma2 family endonuclease